MDGRIAIEQNWQALHNVLATIVAMAGLAATASDPDADSANKLGRKFRFSPLRTGGPPGGRLSRYDPTARRRLRTRDIDEILVHAYSLALFALETPDTS